MSKRVILFLVLVLMGLSAQADYTVTTQQPFYNAQAAGYYPYAQNYNSQYNQVYSQNPYQTQQQYYDPYQCQSPYVDYRNSYPYGVTPGVSGLTSTNVQNQIARNIGKFMILRMMRGY